MAMPWLNRIPRLYCKDCGSIRQPPLAFADPKKHYTRSLERNAYGYRDDEYLKLRIFNLHNATYALTRIFHRIVGYFDRQMA